MTSEQKERLELVTKRLEDELVLQDDFFRACCEMALGKKTSFNSNNESHESLRYLSYRVCRETYGHKNGVYLCLLYAQLFSADCLIKEYSNQIGDVMKDEFICVNRELLSQILLMMTQHDGPDEIRDALYWFYSDYCELFVELFKKLATANVTLAFGGPFLISTLRCSKHEQWKQHTWDCGLYLGKRFEERFFQAIKKTNCPDLYASLFPQETPDAAPENEGFLLTSWQREQWRQMNTQLRLMAKL